VAEETLLIEVASLVLTVGTSVLSLAYWLGRKFARIETRFTIIDENLPKSISNLTKRRRGLHRSMGDSAK